MREKEAVAIRRNEEFAKLEKTMKDMQSELKQVEIAKKQVNFQQYYSFCFYFLISLATQFCFLGNADTYRNSIFEIAFFSSFWKSRKKFIDEISLIICFRFHSHNCDSVRKLIFL